ncbi:MAG TPA: patatin-like phospholipase RssA [Gammaproteobacteria bacterium]|nr:patatin-like phospholipase RssA [Gammaproteobacteria bacterium]
MPAPIHTSHRKLKLGLALGGGAAKGWAHIGVLRILEDLGLIPDIVVGTSIGSLVGAFYVTGNLDDLEHWVSNLSWTDVVTLLDIRFSGGLIRGDKVISELRKQMAGIDINDTPKPFGVVATDLNMGNEVWLREGDIFNAVRASIALPGLFSPIKVNERWLVDGGLVNPVPVSLCRAMGADVVIAVDLTKQGYFQPPIELSSMSPSSSTATEDINTAERLFNVLDSMMGRLRSPKDEALPSVLNVAIRSLNIMTERIARSRLAGDPPEVLIAPKIADISLMEFHRAREAIELGRHATSQQLSQLEHIKHLLGR